MLTHEKATWRKSELTFSKNVKKSKVISKPHLVNIKPNFSTSTRQIESQIIFFLGQLMFDGGSKAGLAHECVQKSSADKTHVIIMKTEH